MKNKTVKVIVLLVGLLVLNIEAAHAGITHKFKIFINHELSDFQLLYVCGALLSVTLLGYIIIMPAFKDKRMYAGGGGYFYNLNQPDYSKRRNRVKKISEILRNANSSE